MKDIDLSRADLNLLVLFEAVLQEGHVGRAAERLSLSPSAVSHGLGRLRRMLQDPVFLRTPRGVVPTARALELALPIAEVLSGVRRVMAAAERFDPARSRRRFTIGAPDGVSAVLLVPILAALGREGPGIDLGLRQLLPKPGTVDPRRAWQAVLDDLEVRAIDLAIVPLDEIPQRFAAQTLYEEDFVVAARAGHPFSADPSLELYCEMRHLVVSLTGDAHGIFDEALAAVGRSRRVAVTVPNFMQALALLAGTDLLAALPRHLVEMHAERFGLICVEAPLPGPATRIQAVATRAAMMDPGVAWLFRVVGQAGPDDVPPRSFGMSGTRPDEPCTGPLKSE